MERIVRIEGLSKSYGKVNALTDINIEIERGKCYGLLGPNGSGKTTLFKIIAGMIRKSGGYLEVFNSTVIDHRVKARLHYLPDENNLYTWMEIRDVIWFFSHLYDGWDMELFNSLFSFLEIPYKRKVSELSRGQRARLKLAIALSTGVELLLLDDPLLGIDVKSRSMVIGAISRYWEPSKQTLFISSHIIRDVEGLFDYVFYIDQGEIVLEGEADELRKKYNKSLEDIVKEEI